MAQFPSIVHLTSHPALLRIRGPHVYEDQVQRPWLPLVMESGSVVQVQLRQEDPGQHVGLANQVPFSLLPWEWALYPGDQYLDSLGRSWRVVYHVLEDGVEEMVLELMSDP